MITMHPGAYLKRSYVEPYRLTQRGLAEALGISTAAISRLLACKADLSPEMAIRLSLVLGRSAESWMEMQTKHSLALARKVVKPSSLTPLSLENADP